MKRVILFFLFMLLGISSKTWAIGNGDIISVINQPITEELVYTSPVTSEYTVVTLAENYPFVSNISFTGSGLSFEITEENMEIFYGGSGSKGYYDLAVIVETQNGSRYTCYIRVVFVV